MERCYKIHGYPDPNKQGFKGKKIAGIAQADGEYPDEMQTYGHPRQPPYHQGDNQHCESHAQGSAGNQPSISPEQYQQLMHLLSQHKIDSDVPSTSKALDF